MASLTDSRSAEAYRRALELPARRRQLAGARDARDRPRPALRRARRRRRADRRRRQPLRRLRLLVGAADPRPRAPGGARGDRQAAGEGTSFGAPTPGEVGAGRPRWRAHAERRDAAHDLLGHRGVDDGDPPRARGDRPRADAEVRGRLPRPRRRPARRRPARAWRRRRCRRARASRRAPRRARSLVPWNDERRCARRRRAPRARGDHGRAVAREHGPRAARAGASSSCCASAPTPTGALLVLDEVISGLSRRRAAARRSCTGVHGRPHDHGQGDRRRPARRPRSAAAAS